MVTIKYNGRFGNCLFQYFLGRIIAEEKGLQLLPYDGQYSHLIGTELVKGNCYTPNYLLTDNSFNLNDILNDKTQMGYFLDGYFQKAEYFLPYKERIKKWLKFKQGAFIIPDIDDIAIHIRRSDFGWQQNAGMLPLSFYTNILKDLNFNKLYIFGGCSHNNEQKDIDEQVIKYFEKYNPVYINYSATIDFQILMCFKRVIQSMSTFCWWATFLSDHANEIYTPITNGGYWDLNNPNINLRVNEERYIYIKNVNVEKW